MFNALTPRRIVVLINKSNIPVLNRGRLNLSLSFSNTTIWNENKHFPPSSSSKRNLSSSSLVERHQPMRISRFSAKKSWQSNKSHTSDWSRAMKNLWQRQSRPRDRKNRREEESVDEAGSMSCYSFQRSISLSDIISVIELLRQRKISFKCCFIDQSSRRRRRCRTKEKFIYFHPNSFSSCCYSMVDSNCSRDDHFPWNYSMKISFVSPLCSVWERIPNWDDVCSTMDRYSTEDLTTRELNYCFVHKQPLIVILVRRRIFLNNLWKSEEKVRPSRKNRCTSNERDVGMKMKATFFDAMLTNEDVVSSRFLPNVIEKDQFFHRTIGNLNSSIENDDEDEEQTSRSSVYFKQRKIFAMIFETLFELITFFQCPRSWMN